MDRIVLSDPRGRSHLKTYHSWVRGTAVPNTMVAGYINFVSLLEAPVVHVIRIVVTSTCIWLGKVSGNSG